MTTIANIADEGNPVPDEVNVGENKQATFHMIEEIDGKFVSLPAEEVFEMWRKHPELAPDAETVEMWHAIADHNKRLSALAKDKKLKTEDVFGRNRVRDDLKEWLADWFKKDLGRECRDADGTINFFRRYEDGCVDNDDLIISALLPLVIEMYDGQYGGNVVGGVDWLRQKTDLFDQYVKKGDYRGAGACITAGEVPMSRFFAG